MRGRGFRVTVNDFLCTSSGGFSRFSSLFPGLCEGKSPPPPTGSPQPGPPTTTSGPTRILPHLYLGCQRDVLDQVRDAPADEGVGRDSVSLYSFQPLFLSRR